MADAKKKEKENFFRRTWRRFVKWLRDLRAELKKVVWPTRKQIIQNSILVCICVVIVGVFIWVFDAVGNLFVQWLIGLFN